LTRAPSARSERPCAAGNWPVLGRSADASSSIAGGSAAVVLLVWEAAALEVTVLEVVAEAELELWEADEEPQPAKASATRPRATRPTKMRAWEVVMP
jgi:hypothetical protein